MLFILLNKEDNSLHVVYPDGIFEPAGQLEMEEEVGENEDGPTRGLVLIFMYLTELDKEEFYHRNCILCTLMIFLIIWLRVKLDAI